MHVQKASIKDRICLHGLTVWKFRGKIPEVGNYIFFLRILNRGILHQLYMDLLIFPLFPELLLILEKIGQFEKDLRGTSQFIL